MNVPGVSLSLIAPTGLIVAGPASAIGIAIEGALSGDLQITGVVNADGAPVSWKIAAGSTGAQFAPASGGTGGGLCNYTLTDPTDAGKATAFWRPSLR